MSTNSRGFGVMRVSALVAVLLFPAAATALPPISSGTLFVHLDAGRGVSVVGSTVTQWEDQSTNAFTFTRSRIMSGQGNDPQLVNNVLNGDPVIRFDGINDILTSTIDVQLFPTTTSGLTIFMVFDTDNNQGQKFVISQSILASCMLR